MNETVIIYGDDPTCHTGFAQVIDSIVTAVSAAGYTPVVVGTKISLSNKYKCEKINALEEGDQVGWGTLEKALEKYCARVLITVGDPWDLQGIYNIGARYKFYWIAYTPVEAKPFPAWYLIERGPNRYLDVGALFSHIDQIVAYTNFGKNAISDMLDEYRRFPGNAGKKINSEVSHVYHGVDVDFFKPEDKAAARSRLEHLKIAEDAILFTCVKVNSSRAGFDALFDAWGAYLKKARSVSPDIAARSKLYLHTNIEGVGYPLPAMLNHTGYLKDKSIIIDKLLQHGSGVSVETMRDIYNATDVFLSTSRGEGFGLPVAEAMACGVPCIVPDYAGPAEYTGAGAVCVKIAATFQPEFSYTRFAIPDIKVFADEMYFLATNVKRRETIGKAARKEIEGYSMRRFLAAWQDIVKTAVQEAATIKQPMIKGAYV